MKKVLSTYYYPLSISILLWMVSLLALSSICYIIKIPINILSIWTINTLFVVGFTSLLSKTYKFSIKQLFLFWAYFLFVVCLSALAVSFIYDSSYDGQSYHGLATLHLNHGWDLFREHLIGGGGYIEVEVLNHCTQGSWIIYNAFYIIFQNFEMAKVVNVLLLISTTGIVYATLRTLSYSKIIALIFALLIGFHPVGINMFLGMYIDGQLASCITIMIALIIRFYRNTFEKVELGVFIAAIIYLLNIKFTGLIYVLFFCGSFVLVVIFEKRLKDYRKPIGAVFIGFFFGLLLVGYPSYVRNTIEHQYPFYPLHHSTTTEGYGVLSFEVTNFKEQNRFLNFVQALFAKTGYNIYYNGDLQYKIPFLMERYELERYAFSGVMIGGLGIWWSGIFCVSLILYVRAFCKDTDKRRRIQIFALFIMVFGSAFVIEAPWWARYAPQVFLVPIIWILYYQKVFKEQVFVFSLATGLFLINSFFIIAPYGYANWQITKHVKGQYQKMKESKKPFYVDFKQSQAQRVRFERYQIAFKEISSDEMTERKLSMDTLYMSEVVFGQ